MGAPVSFFMFYHSKTISDIYYYSEDTILIIVTSYIRVNTDT